jgi:hypothetical protein
VTDHENQLREAFETHEDQAPDPAAVYARVQELSRTYLWRRRGVQAAGGTVVAAGLIAGGLQLPHLLPGQAQNNNVANVTVGAAPAVSPTVTLPASEPAAPKMSPAEAQLQKYYDAYFNAGYDYDDAVALAKIWHSKGNIGSVKAAAGKKLLEGKKLPIEPGSADPAPPVPPTKEEQRVEAFFAAGYDYADAVKLGKLWHTVDPYHAKIEGGKRLLAGQTLPIQP